MLATALPSPLQTVALDVCINADEYAFDRWRRHIGTGADARLLLGRGDERLRRLVSLLYLRFRESGVALDRSLLTYLRTGRAREQFRNESVREICGTALSCLAGAGVNPIVVNGVAAANTIYSEASARHCHDLDLVVRPDEVGIVERALVASEFRRATPRPRASASTVWLSHSSGFGIALHRVPYRVHEWNCDAGAVAERLVTVSITGSTVRVHGHEDALVRIICNGLSAGSRHSPCWAADAALLVQTRTSELDWDQVASVGRSCGRRDAVLIGLEYLKRALRIDVPDQALHALRAESPRDAGDASTADAALLSAYSSRLGLIRRSRQADIFRTAVWALRARVQPT